MRKLVLAATTALLLAGPAFAEVSSVRVSTATTNFGDPAQVQRLYQKLNAAAERVCATPTDLRFTVRPDRTCVEQTVAAAVRTANQPLLTATLDNAGRPLSATASDDR
jgi:UrcA family protein